jgi:hypothetical protein
MPVLKDNKKESLQAKSSMEIFFEKNLSQKMRVIFWN